MNLKTIPFTICSTFDICHILNWRMPSMPRLKDPRVSLQPAHRLPHQEERKQCHYHKHETLGTKVIMGFWQDCQDDRNDKAHSDAEHFGHDQLLVSFHAVQHSIHP